LINRKDESASIEIKKTKQLLKVPCWLESTTPKPAKNRIKCWCQDKTIIGLKTIERKKIPLLELKQ
jgi:hypothetical protein